MENKQILLARPIFRPQYLGDDKSTSMTKHPLYKRWLTLRQKCNDPTAPQYENYGANGVRLYSPWMKSFKNFLKDMGPTYKTGLSITRIDPFGDFEPSNCIWDDVKVEPRNVKRSQKKNVINTPLGLKTIAEAAELYSVPYGVILTRLRGHWSDFDAVTTPYKPRMRAAKPTKNKSDKAKIETGYFHPWRVKHSK